MQNPFGILACCFLNPAPLTTAHNNPFFLFFFCSTMGGEIVLNTHKALENKPRIHDTAKLSFTLYKASVTFTTLTLTDHGPFGRDMGEKKGGGTDKCRQYVSNQIGSTKMRRTCHAGTASRGASCPITASMLSTSQRPHCTSPHTPPSPPHTHTHRHIITHIYGGSELEEKREGGGERWRGRGRGQGERGSAKGDGGTGEGER
jgi:hypothetical protein